MPLGYGLNAPNQNMINRVMLQRAGGVSPRTSLVQRSTQPSILNRSVSRPGVGGSAGLSQGGQQAVKPPTPESTLVVKALIDHLRNLRGVSR